MADKFDKLTVGVLALQGDFGRHQHQIRLVGATDKLVRTPKDLSHLDALILPGGETTTMDKLIDRFAMRQPLIDFANDHPMWGTCAGMILLGKEIEDNLSNVKPLGLMDIDTRRNDYGRQIYSFDEPLEARLNGRPVVLTATFIRAPRVVRCGAGVEILAEFQQSPVLVSEKNLLASSFHTELDEDVRLLSFFLKNYC